MDRIKIKDFDKLKEEFKKRDFEIEEFYSEKNRRIEKIYIMTSPKNILKKIFKKLFNSLIIIRWDKKENNYDAIIYTENFELLDFDDLLFLINTIEKYREKGGKMEEEEEISDEEETEEETEDKEESSEED